MAAWLDASASLNRVRSDPLSERRAWSICASRSKTAAARAAWKSNPAGLVRNVQIEYSAGDGSSIQDGVSIRQVSSVRCP